MTKQEIKEIVQVRDLALQGRVIPARVVQVTFDAKTEKYTHTTLDSGKWQREMAEEHAARVTQARSKLRYSTEEFADLLGTTPRTVTAWERGNRAPTGAARILIEVAVRNPKVVLEAVG